MTKKQKNMGNIRKTVTVCFLMGLLILTGAMSVLATQTDVDEARDQVTEMEKERKKLEATIQSLQGLKADTQVYIQELDENLTQLNQELDQLEIDIKVKEDEITVTAQKLELAQATEAKQYSDMKIRIKYMYERGDTSYLDLLWSAASLSDLLNKAEYFSQITEYDRNMLTEYEATQRQVAEQEARLKAEHAALCVLQESTQGKQTSVQILMDEKNQELANYETKLREAQTQSDAYVRDIAEREARIRKMEEEIRRKEEEARKAAEAAKKKYNTVKLGDIKFIWPCPASSTISSGFGSRTAPIEGASTYHQGLDIAAPTGTDIVAAASGQVMITSYSYASGNYVMISHGGGIYTVYMHCSRFLVTEGTEVEAGQVIAKVGSTGYSTGPHLHFGIRDNGTYLDPQKYVSP